MPIYNPLPWAPTISGSAGVLFERHINPFGAKASGASAMPDCAVADIGALPTTLNGTSTLSAWTTGWADGGPAWVAQTGENLDAFKARVIAACQAAGTVGVVVNVWEPGGFWERNATNKLLSS